MDGMGHEGQGVTLKYMSMTHYPQQITGVLLPLPRFLNRPEEPPGQSFLESVTTVSDGRPYGDRGCADPLSAGGLFHTHQAHAAP